MCRLSLFLTAILVLFGNHASYASEIREFDVKTLERLGNELSRVTRQPDHGATDAIRRRAKQTAIAALNGKLFKIHYDYVVLDDPGSKGFLVYALGTTNKSGELVLAGHVRITVSPDGNKVERVDRVSQTLDIANDREAGLPAGYTLKAYYFNQIVSNKPVETFIYSSNMVKRNIYVGTPDGKVWVVSKGTMRIDKSKPSNKTEAGAVHKAFER
jgi:hypothetical protein